MESESLPLITLLSSLQRYDPVRRFFLVDLFGVLPADVNRVALPDASYHPSFLVEFPSFDL